MKKIILTIIAFVVFGFTNLGESMESNNTPEKVAEHIIKYKAEIRALKSRVEIISSINIPETINGEHLILMEEQAKLYGIPIRILFRLINRESRFDPDAISSSGAKGYMQMMPATFDQYYNKLGLVGGNTPENNIKAGIYFLHELYRYWRWQKDIKNPWELTLASYNSGPTRVKKLRRIPRITETLRYVRYIIR